MDYLYQTGTFLGQVDSDDSDEPMADDDVDEELADDDLDEEGDDSEEM